MPQQLVICWFRQDLRLADNPALTGAASAGRVIPLYILDDINAGTQAMGAASRWWLHHALKQLSQTLKNRLLLLNGDATSLLPQLAKSLGVKQVYWNRCYEPWRQTRDKTITTQLNKTGVDTYVTNGSLLWEPNDALKQDGTPYRVFTPFYRNGCLNAKAPRKPLSIPSNLKLASTTPPTVRALKSAWAPTVTDLALLPAKYHWGDTLAQAWQPNSDSATLKTKRKAPAVGEEHAHARLKQFLTRDLQHYVIGRDVPSKNTVSTLSPYLHFGTLSPNQVWYAAHRRKKHPDAAQAYCRQLVWREFSYHLLQANPTLPTDNHQRKFDAFPWRKDTRALRRWQQGQTGIPIVDAGMRQLWQTGFMHNRIRMVVGSFLVKNLLLDWRLGQAWFWDCLVDADLANNSAGWQWIAGCGADAAPYFRVFNPVRQAQKFDPAGHYIRQYIPELAALPDRFLPQPWTASDSILTAANVQLGKTYPKPIVDLKASRIRALSALASIRP